MKQEAKKITRKHATLVTIAIIITIIIAGGAGYFIYQKFFATPKTKYQQEPTQQNKEKETPKEPSEKQLNITDHTVQVLYSWFIDINVCSKEGTDWNFSNMPNGTITLENMNDESKLDLILRQLELDSIISEVHEGQTLHFTSAQFENAAQKVFGIVPTYKKELLEKVPSQNGFSYSGYFYKFGNYAIDPNTGNYDGTFAASGCEYNDETITFLESASEKDNVLTLNVKVGKIKAENLVNTSREDAIISNLEGQDISNRNDIANHYDQLDTYVYTFEKTEQGQYHFKSVSLKTANR